MRKIFYYIPAVMSLLFYSVLTVVSGFRAVHPLAWGGVGILFLSYVRTDGTAVWEVSCPAAR